MKKTIIEGVGLMSASVGASIATDTSTVLDAVSQGQLIPTPEDITNVSGQVSTILSMLTQLTIFVVTILRARRERRKQNKSNQ